MKAMPISPVMINVIPTPRRGLGMLLYCCNRSLIAAIPTMASSQPNPQPAPAHVAVSMFGKSRCCMNSEPPNMAQLTAIRGKNMPNDAYSDVIYFTTAFSTSCVSDAITAINIFSYRKLKSTVANSGPSHFSAPARST